MRREYNTACWIICISVSIALATLAIILFAGSARAKSYDVNFEAFRETVDDDGTMHLELHGLSLRKGSYDMVIGYVSDSPSRIDISLENDNNLSEDLPVTGPAGGVREYKFTITTGTDRGKIFFSHPAGTALDLAYITISSDKPMYYDSIIFGIVLLLLIPCVWIGVYFYLRSTHKISLLVAVGLVVLQMLPFMLQSGLHLGVDTRAHMMRIEGIYYGLLDGQFPVVIYPEWNNSYGQIGILYPNLFLYIPALFRLMGMSQLGACKLFLFLVIAGSALIALASARSIFRREWQITMTLVIICLDDMRLLDLLNDGRIGGALIAEMFYPLIVAGLIEIFYHNRKKWYLIAYGIAGIFCCHIMTSSIVCIAVGLFVLFAIKKFADREVIRAIGRSILLFIGLVFGTIVLFLKFYFTDWGQEKLQWQDFMSTLWPRGRMLDDVRWIYIITIFVMCAIALMIVIIRKHYDLVRNTYIIPTMSVSVILFLMSTSVFPWGLLRKIPVIDYYTNMLQDSYRFLSLAGCFIAFCLPKLLEFVVMSIEGRRSYESKTTIATCGVIGILSLVSVVFSDYEFFWQNQEMLYYDPVVGDVEIQIEDYLPSGTQTEWYVSDTGYLSDEEAIESLAYERAGTYVYYSYTNSKEGAFVEFPRFYYDGYTAEDEMAERVDVFKGDRNRTRVYLKVTDTPAIIRMWYHVPWYLTLANALSLGLWIASVMIVLARVYHRMD